MLRIVLDKSIGKLVLTTDEPALHYFLEKKQSTYAYKPWTKQWGYIDKIVKIYEPGKNSLGNGLFEYVIGRGWTAYLLGIFQNRLSKDNYNYLLNEVLMADTYRNFPFPELRDYQNEDILFLLKYRVGNCTVNTGYGKTQCIATLTNYFYKTLSKKVLLITPGAKARDELVKRCKSVFNLEVSDKEKKVNGELDCIITTGLVNSKRVKDPEKRKEFIKLLQSYDVVLLDEVEYCMNDGGKFLLNNCTGAERVYGFSGTSDKKLGRVLSFAEGLSDSVLDNRDLISYIGPSLVYRMPLNNEIDLIKIKTYALDNFKIDRSKIVNSGNLYNEITNQIWTNDEICKVVVKVVKKYPKLFIPINNLNFVIKHWIDNYFLGKFRILLICGEGYLYYDLDGSVTNLSLAEVCEYTEKGLIDVFPSTSSGYRALDIPGLESIFLISNKIGGAVLQSVGRIARGKHMNIISLDTYGNRKIPVYTKGCQDRDTMIKNYYQYCNIKEIDIPEDLL